ncbi:hypothetical protein JHK82_020347 [Glycine max]|nr:hypothetical protein JHK86_020361 [Glycine max]KAG5135616.1 hypothetical protein JHK82_020347 [Glycine max]
MSSLDLLLFSLSRAFCSPIAVFFQIQGCLICLTLALGWACAAYVRNREIKQMKDCMKNGNSFSFLCHDINELEHSYQVDLPRVTVIMPLKGFGEHNLHNWRSQITSLYGGPIEFLFVVESTEDPAYHAVSRLIAEFEDHVEAKVVVAGLSTTCSQKIHNQLVGVETMHKDSKYVLFLDDDVRLHPGSIGALTREMEKTPEIFIQTGYPLDLPSGSLGSYCIYEYHMMHADDFRQDRYGVVSGLKDGGYSDDMTLAAISGLSLVTFLAICTLVELLSMWNLTRIEVQLCNMLSPEAPQLSLASYNWCLVFIAMLVDNFLYPVSAFRSHFSQSINWSGIRYYLKDGKISKIERTPRSKDMGPVFTDLGGKHLYGKKGLPTRGSFLSSLSRSLAQWHQPKKFDN